MALDEQFFTFCSKFPVMSNASIREELRQFTNRFRVQDNSLMSFDSQQRRHIKDFQRFAAEKPDGICSACLKKLYPEERYFRKVQDIDTLNCFRWNVTPLTRTDDGVTQYMVCSDHQKELESKFPIYVYPGKLKPNIQYQRLNINKSRILFFK